MSFANNTSYTRQTWLVLLAAGQGSRLQSASLPCRKQFISFGDHPLYWHSALTAARVARLKGMVFVLPEDMLEACAAEIAELAARFRFGLPFKCVAGSPRLRQESVAAGLAVLPPECDSVLIHDSARPMASPKLYNAVLDALAAGAPGAIPGVDIADTVKRVAAEPDGPLLVQDTLPRDELIAVQTPQGFNLKHLREAHTRATQEGRHFTDDAGLLEHCGYSIAVVPGEADNKKITTPEDLDWLAERAARLAASCRQFPDSDQGPPGPAPEVALPDLSHFLPSRMPSATQGRPCTGFGYDVHRYVAPDAAAARPMKLGGVPIAGAPHLEAHSDGDVLIHALMDALLGCLGLGDIGTLFPDTDTTFAGMDSALLLSEVMDLTLKAGLVISHVDVTIIAQIPKINPHRELIRKNLCALLKLEANDLSVKATTEERLGFTGRKEGIKAVVVVSALK